MNSNKLYCFGGSPSLELEIEGNRYHFSEPFLLVLAKEDYVRYAVSPLLTGSLHMSTQGSTEELHERYAYLMLEKVDYKKMDEYYVTLARSLGKDILQ